MAAFVEGGEQEQDQDAVRDQQDRPAGRADGDQCSRRHQRAAVDRQLREPLPVRAPEQARALGPTQARDQGTVIEPLRVHPLRFPPAGDQPTARMFPFLRAARNHARACDAPRRERRGSDERAPARRRWCDEPLYRSAGS